MFTSYFARYKGTKGVAITVMAPAWFTGRSCEALAPTRDILTAVKLGKMSEEEYGKRYLALLDERNIDVPALVAELGDDAVLLCYESGGHFCHRHLAADWLRKRGVTICELDQETALKMKPLFAKP